MLLHPRNILMALACLASIVAMTINAMGVVPLGPGLSRNDLGWLLLVPLLVVVLAQSAALLLRAAEDGQHAQLVAEPVSELTAPVPATSHAGAVAQVRPAGQPSASLPLDIPASIQRMGGREIWDEIIEAWLEEVPRNIGLLRLALDGQDQALAERSAHSIKGCSAEILAEDVRRVSALAEEHCRRGKLQPVREMLSDIEHEFRRVEQLVAEFRAG